MSNCWSLDQQPFQTDEVVMTMPRTAEVLKRTGVSSIDELDDSQLDEVVAALEEDLPRAVAHAKAAAIEASERGGEFSSAAVSPEHLGQALWEQHISQLSRLFASVFVDVVRRYTRKRWGVDVAFVNCGCVVAESSEVDKMKLLQFQIEAQLTPDC